MKHSRLLAMLLALLSFSFQACDKDDDDDKDPTNPVENYDPGQVLIDFSNVANGSDVNEDGGVAYGNNLGQSFRVTMFRYYVSNIVLINDDGTEYVVPDVYHLVNDDIVASRKITINGVPGGSYNGIRFMVGVDASRVAAGNFTGDLDPANGLFMNSTDGFYAFHMEGTCKPNPPDSIPYVYKIGGLGSNNAMKTINLSFNGQKLIVDGTRNADVHIFAEVLDIFRGPQDIDFATTNNITTPGPAAVNLANNYADMFTFNHLHN